MRCDAMQNSSPFVQWLIVFLLDPFVNSKTYWNRFSTSGLVHNMLWYVMISSDDGAAYGKRQTNTEKPHWWTFLIIIYSLGGCTFPCDEKAQMKRQQQKLTTEQFAGAHSRLHSGNRLLCSYPFEQLWINNCTAEWTLPRARYKY